MKTKKTLQNSLLTLFFVLCFSFIACAGETSFSSADSQNINMVVHSSVRSLGLQTQLPTEKTKIVAEDNLLDISSLEQNYDISTIAKVIFYISLAVIAIVIIKTWRDNLWSSSRAQRFGQNIAEIVPTDMVAERMGKAQVEADELARQGRYAEAMHTMLLRCVDELHNKLRVSIAVSLTSREILHHVKLPSEGRDHFADIINRVEISFFGGRRPVVDDYIACRSSYDSLTDALLRYSAQER